MKYIIKIRSPQLIDDPLSQYSLWTTMSNSHALMWWSSNVWGHSHVILKPLLAWHVLRPRGPFQNHVFQVNIDVVEVNVLFLWVPWCTSQCLMVNAPKSYCVVSHLVFGVIPMWDWNFYRRDICCNLGEPFQNHVFQVTIDVVCHFHVLHRNTSIARWSYPFYQCHWPRI